MSKHLRKINQLMLEAIHERTPKLIISSIKLCGLGKGSVRRENLGEFASGVVRVPAWFSWGAVGERGSRWSYRVSSQPANPTLCRLLAGCHSSSLPLLNLTVQDSGAISMIQEELQAAAAVVLGA